MSGNNGKSGSSSSSSSEQFSESFIDPAQVSFLQNLREQGQSLTGQLLPDIQQNFAPAAGQLATQARQALGQLLGFQAPDAGASVDRYQRGVIDPLVEQLGQDIQRQTGRAISGAGGVDSSFAGSRTLGGGRNQVERALTNEAGINAFQRGATELRGRGAELGQREAALDLQGAGMERDALTSALALGPGVTDMGLAGARGQLLPLMAMRDLIGAPTVLSRSRGSSQSSSSSQVGFFDTLANLTGAGVFGP